MFIVHFSLFIVHCSLFIVKVYSLSELVLHIVKIEDVSSTYTKEQLSEQLLPLRYHIFRVTDNTKEQLSEQLYPLRYHIYRVTDNTKEHLSEQLLPLRYHVYRVTDNTKEQLSEQLLPLRYHVNRVTDKLWNCEDDPNSKKKWLFEAWFWFLHKVFWRYTKWSICQFWHTRTLNSRKRIKQIPYNHFLSLILCG